jgi:hypothetical protein
MAYFASIPYRNATAIANHLMSLILVAKPDDRNVALIAREWREIEQMKREWRGLPRLSPIAAKELLALKRARAAVVEESQPFEELPTVTAPPPVGAPEAR